LTNENIYYLLPLIYTCEYGYIYPRVSGIHSGFGYPFGFRVSAGLVLVMDFHPNPYIHYNICNIQMKHMQHLDETIKTFGTHTCNMLLKIAEIFETYTCNICV
jgi:RNase adaptor protein for sRNA GlmZ degradation